MLIITSASYEAQVVPKGCRNPRRGTCSTTLSLDIAEPSDAEAPLAFERHVCDRQWNRHTERHEDVDAWRPYRAWRGRLWAPAGLRADEASDHIAQVAGKAPSSYQDRERAAEDKVQRAAAQWAASVFVLNDILWEPADEPCLIIQEAGYGQHYWDITLVTENHQAERAEDGLIFRLDELDEAKREAARLNADTAPQCAADVAEVATFSLDADIRNIRRDLLTRDPWRDQQARIRLSAAARSVSLARERVRSARQDMNLLQASIASGHCPRCIDPARISAMLAALATIDDIGTRGLHVSGAVEAELAA